MVACLDAALHFRPKAVRARCREEVPERRWLRTGRQRTPSCRNDGVPKQRWPADILVGAAIHRTVAQAIVAGQV